MTRAFFVTVLVSIALLFTTIAAAAEPPSRAVRTADIPLRNWRVVIPGSAPQQATPVISTEGRHLGVETNVTVMPSNFVAVAPCRVADTRNPAGAFGGPYLVGGAVRTFTIPSGPCPGIPTTAAGYSFNFTIVSPAAGGWLTAWPAGGTQPGVSTLNYLAGQTVANAAIVPAGTSGGISVSSVADAHLIIDINGYFVSNESGTDTSLGSTFDFFSAIASNKTFASVTVSAPASGNIVVHASGYLGLSHTTGTSSLGCLNLQTNPAASVYDLNGINCAMVPAPAPTGDWYMYPIGITQYFSVSVPTTLTVYLVGYLEQGTNPTNSFVSRARVTAEYVPVSR